MNFMDDFEQRGLIQQNDGVAAARLAKLQDTEIEGMLMTDDLLNSPALFALISRLHWKSAARISPIRGAFDASRHEMLQEFFMKHNMFVS